MIDARKFHANPGLADKCIEACHTNFNVPDFGNSKDEIKWLWKMPFANAFPAELDTVGGMVGTGWNDYIDTNGDGFVNALDDPRIMPVTIRIRWRAQSGMATKYFSTIIGRR